MTTTRVVVTADVRADRFVAALTDFGPRRAELFGASDPTQYVLHERGDTWAEVTEGARAGGVWQRLRYDWSTPGSVQLDVLDSNTFGRGSSWRYRISPAAHDGCRVELTVHRVPVSLRGRLLDPVLWAVGRYYFGRDLRRTLVRLKTRTDT